MVIDYYIVLIMIIIWYYIFKRLVDSFENCKWIFITI